MLIFKFSILEIQGVFKNLQNENHESKNFQVDPKFSKHFDPNLTILNGFNIQVHDYNLLILQAFQTLTSHGSKAVPSKVKILQSHLLCKCQS